MFRIFPFPRFRNRRIVRRRRFFRRAL